MVEETDPREGEKFFLNDPLKLDNPFPDFKYFRESKPVFYYEPLDTWFIFNYEDVDSLFHDPRLSSKRMEGFIDAAPAEVREELKGIAAYFSKWVFMKDGEDHARLRRFMQIGFSPHMIDRLVPAIQEATDSLLNQVADQGQMDGSEDFGFLLPLIVLADLIGVPKADYNKALRWSVDLTDFFNILPIRVETCQRLNQSGYEFIDYMRALIAKRRTEPRIDFLSQLIHAKPEDGVFDEDEVIANSMVLLLAGHVAVRNLIGNAIYLLLTHPGQLAKLKANPSLLTNVVEETLRVEPPVTMVARIAAVDFLFHSHLIRKGQFVQLCIASANRDEQHFSEPDSFDISRHPNKHLSFASGIHSCLGSILAKQEAHIALETLFRRMPGLRFDQNKETQWYRNAGNRGPVKLPLAF